MTADDDYDHDVNKLQEHSQRRSCCQNREKAFLILA